MPIKLQNVLQLSAAVMLSTTFATTAQAEELVRNGQAAPLTGDIARLGKDQENGAVLAVEEINAKGLTIGGRKITLQLDPEDDAGDPRTATQVAQKLVDDKVVAIVGHANSGTSIPASKIYSDAGIVQISPSATNPAYTQQGFKTTYRLVATDARQGPALANYAAKTMKAKSVAIVDDSTAHGQGLAGDFEKTARSLGLKVVSHDATNDKAVDFRAILTKIKGENPDVIMYGGMDATGGPFAKQAMQLGVRARVLAGDSVCSENLSVLAGTAADTVVCSQAGLALEMIARGTAFEEKYMKRFGIPVLSSAPVSYDAVYIIVDAMKRAGSTDPAKILEAMPGTDYKGVLGKTTFDSKVNLKHGVVTLYV